MLDFPTLCHQFCVIWHFSNIHWSNHPTSCIKRPTYIQYDSNLQTRKNFSGSRAVRNLMNLMQFEFNFSDKVICGIVSQRKLRVKRIEMPPNESESTVIR